MNIRIAVTGFLAALGVAAPASAQVVLVNGSFEAPVVVSNFTGYAPPGPGAFGWIVTGDSINHGRRPAQTTCQAGLSTQCVELNGNGPGAIQQTFATVQWQKYRVTFFMSRHRELILGNVPATMDALVNSNVVAHFSHSLTGAAAAVSGGWQSRYFFFVAPTTSTTLRFASTAPQGAAGPQIDNVSITEVASYDLAVKKQHDGHKYTIVAKNPGQPIAAGMKIQVVDYVPNGLTVTVAANNAPWTCAPVGVVTGPGTVTCAYVSSAVIATGSSLPAIQFDGDGSPVWANCARVNLYYPLVHFDPDVHAEKKRPGTPAATASKSLIQVQESNPDNNGSCAP